jgi:hypothetical protein
MKGKFIIQGERNKKRAHEVRKAIEDMPVEAYYDGITIPQDYGKIAEYTVKKDKEERISTENSYIVEKKVTNISVMGYGMLEEAIKEDFEWVNSIMGETEVRFRGITFLLCETK